MHLRRYTHVYSKRADRTRLTAHAHTPPRATYATAAMMTGDTQPTHKHSTAQAPLTSCNTTAPPDPLRVHESTAQPPPPRLLLPLLPPAPPPAPAPSGEARCRVSRHRPPTRQRLHERLPPALWLPLRRASTPPARTRRQTTRRAAGAAAAAHGAACARRCCCCRSPRRRCCLRPRSLWQQRGHPATPLTGCTG
jgi:hypothetical protein